MDIRGGIVPERMVSNPRIRFSDEWLVRVDGESPAKRTTFYISVCLIDTIPRNNAFYAREGIIFGIG